MATLRIDVYDVNLRWRGTVGNPVSASFTQRYLAMGSGEITVEATDPILEYLLAPGARVRAAYEGRTEFDGSPLAISRHSGPALLSGPVRDPRGSFLPGGNITVSVSDDWRVLRNTLARVVDGGTLKASSLTDAAQGAIVDAGIRASGTTAGLSGSFDWGRVLDMGSTQTASAAALQLIRDPLARVAAATGRTIASTSYGDSPAGQDVRAVLPRVRFGTLEDYVAPLLSAYGVGLTVTQTGGVFGPSYLEAATYHPVTWPRVFTPETGILLGGEWGLSYPVVSDVIVGGPGEEAARAFRGFADPAVRAAYGEVVEVFREATGAAIEWPEALAEAQRVAMYYHLRPEVASAAKVTFEAELKAAALGVIDEGRATASVSLEIAESPAFRFTGSPIGRPTPGFFATGDIMTVAPSESSAASGLKFTERITEVTVGLSRSKGLTVTPQLGARSNDPDVALSRAVRTLADAARRRATSH